MNKCVARTVSAILSIILVCCAALPALAEDKKETVFVIADAEGNTRDITVSERLYNPE